MEEMKFSNKRTGTEKKDSMGPVHYIAHHAVVHPKKEEYTDQDHVQQFSIIQRPHPERLLVQGT